MSPDGFASGAMRCPHCRGPRHIGEGEGGCPLRIPPDIGSATALMADEHATRAYGGKGLYFEFGSKTGTTWLSTVQVPDDDATEVVTVAIPTVKFKLLMTDLIGKDPEFAALAAQALASALTEKADKA